MKMLNSSAFLKKFIDEGRTLPELEQLPYSVYFKDLDSKYITANDNVLKLFDISLEDLVGKSDKELIQDEATANRFVDNDQQVLNERRIVVFNEPARIGNRDLGLLTIKAPLYDNQTIVGVYGIAVDLVEVNFADLNYFSRIMSRYFNYDFRPKDFIGTRTADRPKLTPRETECLGYYLQGFSAQQIANELDLSRRTIEFYISKIKVKLQTQKRQELITKAIKLYPELLA